MNKTKNVYLIVGILAAVLVTVAVFVLGSSDDREATPGATARANDANADPFADPFLQPSGGKGYNDFEDELKSYVEYARYPPLSRPLRPEMKHLLQPNLRYETWEPAGIPPADDRDWQAPYHYLLTADRYFLTGDETINFSLETQRDPDEDDSRIELTIREASIHRGLKQPRDDTRRVADLKFEWNEKAGKYTASLQPAATTGLAAHAGPIRLRLRYGQAGTQEDNTATLVFEYYPENKIPARFTGNFREEVKEGSLWVYAELDVKQAGWYNLDANLTDAGDVPIAFARYKGELKQGRQEAPIQFFGKVIRDKDGESPFRVHGLRGFLALEPKPGEQPAVEGGRLVVPIYAGEYKTARYNDSEVFSEAEWEHPSKQMRLDYLREQVRQQ